MRDQAAERRVAAGHVQAAVRRAEAREHEDRRPRRMDAALRRLSHRAMPSMLEPRRYRSIR
jgi:hypothetical protein